jgi:hypothetical protein
MEASDSSLHVSTMYIYNWTFFSDNDLIVNGTWANKWVGLQETANIYFMASLVPQLLEDAKTTTKII